MRGDVNDRDGLVSELFDLSIGERIPLHTLLNTGAFPVGWVDKYLALLGEVEGAFDGADPLPRRLTAAVYNASVYCTKRYGDWLRLGGTLNERTERELQQIRWAGDRLLVLPFYREMHGA